MIPVVKAAAILTALRTLDLALADADQEYAEEQLKVALADAGDGDKVDNFVHNIGQCLVCEDMSFLISLINDIEEAEK